MRECRDLGPVKAVHRAQAAPYQKGVPVEELASVIRGRAQLLWGQAEATQLCDPDCHQNECDQLADSGDLHASHSVIVLSSQHIEGHVCELTDECHVTAETPIAPEVHRNATHRSVKDSTLCHEVLVSHRYIKGRHCCNFGTV